MREKPKVTQRSRVKSALRKLWMMSPERNLAIKNAGRRCQVCGVKASQAAGREVVINAHHIFGIDWKELVDLVFDRLIRPSDEYEILCEKCHEKEHEDERIKITINKQAIHVFPIAPRDAADDSD